MNAEAEALRRQLELVTLERDTLADELAWLRARLLAEEAHQAACAVLDSRPTPPIDVPEFSRPTPPETPSSKAIEAALTAMGPQEKP